MLIESGDRSQKRAFLYEGGIQTELRFQSRSRSKSKYPKSSSSMHIDTLHGAHLNGDSMTGLESGINR